MTLKLFLLILGFATSITGTVFYLIKKNRLSEEYSSIWLLVSGLLFFSALFSRKILELYAFFKGDAGSGPEILVMLSLVFVVFFLILVSVKLSVYKKEIMRLNQYVGLLQKSINDTIASSKKE